MPLLSEHRRSRGERRGLLGAGDGVSPARGGLDTSRAWRVRAIPRLSFVLVFLALLPFPLYALTGDEALVIRLVSGIVVVAY